MLNKHNLITIASALTLTLFSYIFITNRTLLRNIDSQFAATCTTPYTIIPAPSNTFTAKCLQTNTQIYSDDTRFSFYQIPSVLANASYIQTPNVALKGNSTLSWSINLTTPSNVYVLTRYLGPNSVSPTWITQNYTKLTPSTANATTLSQYVVRSSTQTPTKYGAYDVWQKNSNLTTGTVTFSRAADAGQTAYSMYLVAIKTPPSTNTPNPTIVPTRSPSPTQLRTSSPAPTATTPSTSATYPAQILNLTNWKITLPTGSSGSPTEIKQPALNTYKIDPWFVVQGSAVRFRAPVNGVTTSGSSYPRSELREMTNNGSANASWSSGSGTHSMFIDQMVTSLPKVKTHLVVGQIHDASDDVTVFRVEGNSLYITNGNTTHGYLVDGNFTLNKRFSVKFEVSNNVTKYYYNGTLLPYTLNRSYSGAYFKAGAYTQANCSNSSPCASDNYGEALIYNVAVAH
jgi:hypothetical protein